MWVAECLIDSRGRLTLPKSFMKAKQNEKVASSEEKAKGYASLSFWTK